MKGAFRFPMIKVVSGGGGENPDPAIYCPANGYVDPNNAEEIGVACISAGYIPDPSVYVPDPIINEIMPPPTGKIRLVVEDNGMRHLYLSATVSNSGKFTVTIIGADNTQLAQTSYTSGSNANIYLPTAAGFLSASGVYYYYADITSELPANNLLTFKVSVSSTVDEMGGYVIAAFINAPTLTSLASAFASIKRIRHIEFLCECTSLTTLASFAHTATSLRRLIFISLPEVTSMIGMLYATNYVLVDFPTVIPKLTTANSMYNTAKSANANLGFEAPLLSDLSLCFSAAEVSLITFSAASFPELTTIYQFCYNNTSLKGTVNLPQMPKLTTMASAFSGCLAVEQIIFNGAMNSLTTWQYMANNCIALKKIVLPESVIGMPIFTNLASSAVFSNCNNLEEVVLPKVWKPINNTNGYNFNNFFGCTKLKTISMIEETENLQCGLLSGGYLLALERFDQPNAFWASSTNYSISFAKGTGVQGKLVYFEMDWDNSPKVAILLERNNLNFAEVRRILARQNPLKSTTFHAFGLVGNPLIDVHLLSEPTLSGANHTFTMLRSNYNENIVKVGSSWYAQQNTKNGVPIVIKADNTFTLGTSWTRAPLNGVKMVVPTNIYSSYGMLPYKVFYVVNSQGTSGNVFQLSETLGGQPYAFNFGAELLNTNITVLASCNVVAVSVGATNVTVTISFPYYPNSGSRQGYFCNCDAFDWWEMAEKGYVPNV